MPCAKRYVFHSGSTAYERLLYTQDAIWNMYIRTLGYVYMLARCVCAPLTIYNNPHLRALIACACIIAS